MISPQMATDIVTPYPPTMEELDKKVRELWDSNHDLQNSVSYWRTQVVEYQSMVEGVRNYIISEMKNSDFDEDAAQTIADIMNFSLAKEHYFTVTVRFSGTVEVKPGDDAEEIISNMNFEMEDSYHTDVDFQLDDVTVENTEVEESN